MTVNRTQNSDGRELKATVVDQTHIHHTNDSHQMNDYKKQKIGSHFLMKKSIAHRLQWTSW